MQDNAEQSAVRTSTMSSIASFERCVLELAANSLSARATAIAVRIHAGKREIQVVDNGDGIPRDLLERVAEYEAVANGQRRRVYEPESHYLADIRRLSDRLTVTSRHRYSKGTFVKAFEVGFAPSLKEIEQRPTCGTTVSVYGFHEIPPLKKWDVSTVCLLIAAVAVAELEVSFSIRDEDRKKVVLRIARPHSPLEVLRTLFGKGLPLSHVWSIQCGPEFSANYHGYVGLSSDRNAMQWIFLNHRPICYPLILRLIKIAFKERLDLPPDRVSNARDPYDRNMFILFFLTFSQREFTLVTEGVRSYIMFYDMQKILNAIKNCAFKRLAENATVSTVTPYACNTRLLKRIEVRKKILKSEKSSSDNSRKNVTSSLIKNKVVTIGFERGKTSSTVVTDRFNTQHRDDNIEGIKRYMGKKNNVLNNTRTHRQIISVKHANLCEDKATKKVHNSDDKVQGGSMNFDIADNSIKAEAAYNNHGDNKDNFTDMISPLSEWSNWTYYTNNKKRDPTRNMNDIISDIRPRQFFESNNQFDFLPRKLYGLLHRRHIKLTNVRYFNSPNDTIPFTENWQQKQIAVHPCKLKQKLCEFRLSRASLKCIKIINQVNDEFIAAWMAYDEMKILLMIDQHAIHERIRYENLLLRYNVQSESELLSVNLRDPLSMEFSTEMCTLLLHNKTLLKKYGINLGSSKDNTLLIRTIPQCLVTNSDPCNSEKILSRIRSLLNEVLKNRSTSQANALPLIIHNAIASEACHGAIKFGDKLTLEECTNLVKLLKHTRLPNRCAHGRPTIIPVMEFSELGKRNAKIPEVCVAVVLFPILLQ